MINEDEISFSRVEAKELLNKKYFKGCSIEEGLIKDSSVSKLLLLTYECFDKVVNRSPKVTYNMMPVVADLRSWARFYSINRGYTVCAAGAVFLYAYGHVWEGKSRIGEGMEVIDLLRVKNGWASNVLLPALGLDLELRKDPEELEFLDLLKELSRITNKA